MASQYNLAHPAACPPVINDERIEVNDKFANTVDIQITAQRSFMLNGRTVSAGERGSDPKTNYTDALE